MTDTEHTEHTEHTVEHTEGDEEEQHGRHERPEPDPGTTYKEPTVDTEGMGDPEGDR